MNAEFQGIARRDKKAFLSDQYLLNGKDPDAGRDWGQEEKGTTEDDMAGWHHRLNGQEFG